MAPLKPNGKRAKNAITLIWITLVAEVFVLLSEVLLYNVLTKANKGEIDLTDISYVTSVEYAQIAINAIAIVIYVISCITFIQWFRRAYYNLGQIVKNLSYEEGWAAGSWFVPILNYFRPYQIMKELYKKTKKTLIQSKVTTNTNLRTQYLNLWWAFWVVNSIAGSVSFRLSLYSETIEELLFLGIFNIALSVWFFLTGFLAIKVIKDYAKVEPLLVEVLKGDKTARSEEK